MKIIYPFNSSFRITSPYGTRTLNGQSQFHYGIDMVGTNSKTICAVCSGKVQDIIQITDKSNRTWERGLHIKLLDGDGRIWYYCHLSSVLVGKGESVNAGQHIGIEGSTGYSTGSHLHLEVRENGTPINPAPLLGIDNSLGIISPDYASTVRTRFSLSDDTIKYLKAYQWGDDLLRKLEQSE